MATLARTRPARRRTLTEDALPLRVERVDREAGVIYGVKILGLESPNEGGRRYLPEAIKAAIPLYEGAKAKTNHPVRAGQHRDVLETFGWFESCRQDDKGELFGDLHLLNPKSELAESLYNAADHNPSLFGFSHNAQGDTYRDGKTEVVREILEVRSIDLVDNPATTKGLFEDRRGTVKIKLREWVEKLHKLPAGGKKRLKRLCEAGVMDPEMEAELGGEMPAEEAPAADHEAALKDGFEASISALVGDSLDGSLDPTEALKKIKELLTSHAKLAGGGKEDVEEEDEDEEKDVEEEEECDDEEGKKKMKESRELKLLRAEKRGRILCEEAGVAPDSPLLEALACLPDEKAMKRLIDREKGRSASSGRGKPRTQLRESADSSSDEVSVKSITDGKTFAAALRNGRH